MTPFLPLWALSKVDASIVRINNIRHCFQGDFHVPGQDQEMIPSVPLRQTRR